MVEPLRTGPWLLAQVAESSEQLPPPTKAAAMMALLAILLLGMLLIVAILLGGHWVRRLGSYRRGPAVPPDMNFDSPPKKHDSDEPSQPPNPGFNDGETMIPDDTKC